MTTLEAAPQTETPPAAVSAGGRDARARRLGQILGPPTTPAKALADAIRGVARHHFELQVRPLVARHWPSVLDTPFMEKLRIGACDLYAVAPYTALFCGQQPPPVVRAFITLGDRLPLTDAAFSRLGGLLMSGLGRAALQRTHRQIATVAAFIVVVDHVFDHCLTQPPAARGRHLAAIIAGDTPPDSDPTRLVAALSRAMAADLAPGQAPVFAAAMAKVFAWLDAEVLALSGAPDPNGEGHRRAGVEGTIAGLLFPIGNRAGDAAHAWMNDVSMFVQMVDDVLDIERDILDGRPTPATAGHWNLATVEAAWHRTRTGLAALVRARDPGLRAFPARMVAVYDLMMVELVAAMIARPADGLDGGSEVLPGGAAC
jgi:hypothetical protein